MKRGLDLGLVMGIVVGAALSLAAISAHADTPTLDCELRFELSGWSVIYKEASGTGTVHCENGQSMRVKLEAKGGGLTAGKWRVRDGRGTFTDIYRIEEVLGTYAQGEATAAAGHAATAQVMTKGTVSLALAGTGEGVNLGISVGGLTISRAD